MEGFVGHLVPSASIQRWTSVSIVAVSDRPTTTDPIGRSVASLIAAWL